jgi:cardiolipin synthase A/B
MSGLFYIAWIFLTLWSILHLLIHKREPSSTLSWLLFVTFIPILGAVIFLVFGPQRLERNALKRKEKLHQTALIEREGESPSGSAIPDGLLERADTQVLRLAKQISEYEVTAGNSVELLADPLITLNEMHASIASAKRFIHLEYYIISADEVTEQLFEGLSQAADRGVEVRILYDALGSLFLKQRYFKPLAKKGVRTAGFLPFSLVPQRFNFNFRNHRKILIVDGTTAFTGGTNIGKEYLGKRTEHQWRDFSVKVSGPVCLQLQDVFAKDWMFTTGEDLFNSEYYPRSSYVGNSVVQVMESGPDTAFQTLHHALFLAINSAENQVLLTTPYFIPDSSMMSALAVAALRGVDVQILLPLKSDSLLVQNASRSFYDNLLRAGAKIFEYQPRILHAKMLVIDNKWTIIGSSNMDIRSFRLNFELNLLVYGPSLAHQAMEIFQDDLKNSKQVDRHLFMLRPLRQQMAENACRLLSPIL